MASLVLIKPDAVSCGMIGEIISLFEQDYKITQMRMLLAERELLVQHYVEHVNKVFFTDLIRAMMEGHLVALRVLGNWSQVRHRCTEFREARKAICRGPYNLVHSSDSDTSATCELKLWFPNAN